ncbi:carbon-nitrogen hydrolase [Apiospora kogelbergensis]|uniref:Carbon-nitrogen hydrolase n=1 Tax=Apiospora kogelbergensis TaxID=1337665 RepID=A0AAW0QLN5_9PEZI
MAPSTTKFRVAAAHAAPIFMDKAATIKKVIGLIEQAALDEIKLLVFPETFVPGYPVILDRMLPPLAQVGALAKYAEESVVAESNNEDMGPIQAACRRTGVAINLGISERMARGYSLFNSQVTVDGDGTILGVHRKLQPTYVERVVWAQGDGSTLRNWPLSALGGRNLGGLACWEHTMNGARQALITQHQHIHAGAWPALSTMAGFEAVADAQIEALMKTHALTAQVFVVTASNYIDEACIDWMEANLGGKQDFIKPGGGWSAILHPFCSYLAGPHTGAEEKLVQAEVDFAQLGAVKVWIDAAGHYQRPEILQFSFDSRPHWADEVGRSFEPRLEEERAGTGGGGERET